MLLITHDLGIVARVAHRVSVMYAGEVVESAATAELFANPKHPYTQGLLRCVPVPGKTRRDEPLGSIPGTVPRIGPGFEGCAFRERCDFADATCAHADPAPCRERRPTTSSAGCRHDAPPAIEVKARPQDLPRQGRAAGRRPSCRGGRRRLLRRAAGRRAGRRGRIGLRQVHARAPDPGPARADRGRHRGRRPARRSTWTAAPARG